LQAASHFFVPLEQCSPTFTSKQNISTTTLLSSPLFNQGRALSTHKLRSISFMTHTFLKKESMKMIKIKYRVKGCLHGTAHIGMNKLQP